MMEKYGVFTEESADKLGSNEFHCPDCGALIERHGKVLRCPRCGTKPFEEPNGKEEGGSSE